MGFNGSGVFIRSNGVQVGATLWQDNEAASDKTITGLKHDNNDQDIANGLSSVVTRDGQSPATNNLPMGGFKHTGVTPASGLTSATEYASGTVAQATRSADAGVTGGTSANYTAVLSPVLVAYADKQLFRVQFHVANAVNADIAFNGLPSPKKIYINVAGVATQLPVSTFPDDYVGLLRYDTALDGATGGFWLLNQPADLSGYVPTTRTLTAGLGLSGGGDLSADRTFDFAPVELSTVTVTTADLIVISDASDSGSPKLVATTGLPGSTVKGTPLVQDPIAASATVTQAHGLGGVPDFCTAEIECKTGELGYTAGQIVEFSANGMDNGTNLAAYSLLKTATDLSIATGSAVNLNIINRSTNAVANITPANWLLRIIPKKIN
jgi:hypothetical protein